MVTLKFKRIGKKGQPSFRIVVQPKRSKVNGRFIEDLGWYNPITKKSEIYVNRVDYWIKNGAQPTPTVHNLLVKEGVIKAPKIPVHKKIAPKEAKVAAVKAEPEEVKAEPEKQRAEPAVEAVSVDK